MGSDPGGIRSGWEQGRDGAKVRADPNSPARTCNYTAGAHNNSSIITTSYFVYCTYGREKAQQHQHEAVVKL